MKKMSGKEWADSATEAGADWRLKSGAGAEVQLFQGTS